MQLGHGWRLWCVAVWFAAVPALAVAQSEPATDAQGLRVAVLRATEGDASKLSADVDGALLRDLAAIAGIDNPTVSPIDYAEIQLTVGCSDEGRQCLSSIAQMVQVDAVMVRHLAVQPGHVALTVTYFDATASDEPSRADFSGEGDDAGQKAVAAVPSLVRKLFGIPEPVVAASAASEAQEAPAGATSAADSAGDFDAGNRAKIRALTWITLAAGGGILAGGLAVGATAQSSFDSYKKFEVKTMADVGRANSKFDGVKSKALVANVLIPSGAAIMALGGVLLALDLMRDDKKAASFGLFPLRGGALLTLHGVAGGL